MPTVQTVEAVTVPTEFEKLLEDRAVDAVFQPIVHIESGEPVGYEALARGPAGSVFASPAALFAEAYRTDRQDELDWVCRAAAIRQALAAGLSPTTPLFINVEPGSLGSPCPPDLLPVVSAATGRLRILLEVTERSIATDPAGLLSAVAGARAMAMGLALDDVGADPTSLAMMPLLRPDVIKLDLSLIQGRPTPALARTVEAVLTEAEHTGAAIVAEGVESPRHVEVARSLGATLGQGWYYGRPGPLPTRPIPMRSAVPVVPAPPGDATTPFEAAAGRRTSRAIEHLLFPMVLHMERKGLDAAEPAVLLVCLPWARPVSGAARRRYRRIASRGVFTAVLGTEVAAEPAAGVRAARLDRDDPLAREWNVIVLGPHFAGALLAKARGDGPDRRRHFEFLVTHDRDLVIAAARPLLDRLPPSRFG